jgi:hypothetical protein
LIFPDYPNPEGSRENQFTTSNEAWNLSFNKNNKIRNKKSGNNKLNPGSKGIPTVT